MDYSNKPKGLKRIVLAFSNSIRALVWLARNEAAFRQELVLSLVLVMITFALDITWGERFILWSTLLFVLFSEIVNTAIESVVDRIGYEHHDLSGLAKDLGSLAVMISFAIAGLIWAYVLFN
ncbi:diacylglycerol kinase [Parashewanella tropica]|uniref:diacylglycerol kinase n=1 Tax=Parashewanella tropica TaxID=2547970 RepID=UPI00105A7D39|nr:diacylglycerol kinase [Parashewanella tropica]